MMLLKCLGSNCKIRDTCIYRLYSLADNSLDGYYLPVMYNDKNNTCVNLGHLEKIIIDGE